MCNTEVRDRLTYTRAQTPFARSIGSICIEYLALLHNYLRVLAQPVHGSPKPRIQGHAAAYSLIRPSCRLQPRVEYQPLKNVCRQNGAFCGVVHADSVQGLDHRLLQLVPNKCINL